MALFRPVSEDEIVPGRKARIEGSRTRGPDSALPGVGRCRPGWLNLLADTR